ncbi:MAG: 50S ribosomal protein L24 [Planctomycetes bacterium]|nr:50S ribosomal protein L24 [Planctomycetota bacterium]
MHIKVDDIVIVIAGNDKDVKGKVLAVDARNGKVLVEGVNKVHKHVRRSAKNPQGGRLSKEMPIDISNVMLVDPKTGKPTRVGFRYLEDGSKERYAKKSGQSLGVVAPARPAYAKKA